MVAFIFVTFHAPGVHAAADAHGATAIPAADKVQIGLRSDSPAMQQGLPLKRDDADGIGSSAAIATAGALLLLSVWAVVQLRARQQRGVQPRWLRRIGWLGQWSQAPGDRSLRVLESAPLSPQVRVHVVGWRNKQYLISTSSQSVTVLDTIETAIEGKTSRDVSPTSAKGRK